MVFRADYTQTLDKLTALLRRKPLTAKAIAAAMGCCKPAVYHRIAALRERGEQLYSFSTRESPTGPMSTAYGIR